MNISARNKLIGKVSKITAGVVNAEVVIAAIKASDILLAVPCGNPNCKCGK